MQQPASIEFRPQPLLTWVVLILLGVGVMMDLTGVVIECFQIELLARIVNGIYVSEDEATINDMIAGIWAVFRICAYLAAGVAFLNWFYNAYRNLQAFGASGLRMKSPGWAVGWFFIPVAWLFKPFQAAQDIWKASNFQVNLQADPMGWKQSNGFVLLGLWWTFWVIGGLMDQVCLQLGLRAKIPQDFLNVAYLSLVSNLISVIGGILCAWVVWAVYQRQLNKSKQLITLSDNPV